MIDRGRDRTSGVGFGDLQAFNQLDKGEGVSFFVWVSAKMLNGVFSKFLEY